MGSYGTAATVGFIEGTENWQCNPEVSMTLYAGGWMLGAKAVKEITGELEPFNYAIIPITLEITRKTFQIAGLTYRFVEYNL